MQLMIIFHFALAMAPIHSKNVMATEFEIGHENFCSKVCVVCCRKASRMLSVAEIKVVQDYVIDGYDESHPDFPNDEFHWKRTDSMFMTLSFQ